MKIIFRIFLVLILLAVVGGGFFVYKHTDGCNSEFKTFYVEYNGGHLLQASDALYEKGSEQRFDVKYTFDFIDKEQTGYNVKIVPNGNAESIEYQIDNRYYLFSALDDLTAAFDIELNDSYFTLSIPQDFTVRKVIETLYKGKTVDIDGDYDESGEKYYTLIITSYDGKISYSVNFGIAVHVRGVALDITKIEF